MDDGGESVEIEDNGRGSGGGGKMKGGKRRACRGADYRLSYILTYFIVGLSKPRGSEALELSKFSFSVRT